jgi:hypothetical protein
MSSSSVIASLMSQFQGEDGKMTIPQDKLIEAIALMESQPDDDEVEKPKKRKAKKVKDPNAPKRAISGYLRWLEVNRSQIKAGLDEGHKHTEVMVEAGKQWKALGASEKTPFEEAFKEDQLRYKAEMAEYKPTAPVDSYSSEEYPEAPEGWSGPYQLKYLWKHAGPDGKAMRFKDFDEAIKAAATIDDCKGITKTSKWYELRRGPDLMSATSGKESSSLASWVKGEPVEPVVMVPTVEASPEPTSPVEVEKSSPVPKKKSLMKKVKIVVPEPEPEPEPEVEEQSDDEEGCEVDEVVIEGSTYYKAKDGTLYDPDTSEEMGKLVDGEIVKE